MAESHSPKDKRVDTPDLFPNLTGLESSVGQGEYEVLEGDSESVVIDPEKLFFTPEGSTDEPHPFPGVTKRGYCVSDSGKSDIVSFLYHKLDGDGNLEETERTIIWKGTGFGEHPGHTGQPATWYLIGPEVGRTDHETGRLVTDLPEDPVEISSKHFSIACMANGPLGQPILANPA